MASTSEILQPNKSSMFSRAGYDSDNWLLLLEFKSTGEIRAYKDVAPETADAALTAESLGKWWNANVRNSPSWEYEIIVPAEPARPKEKAAPSVKASEAGMITVDDIQAVDPTYELPESDAGGITMENLQAAFARTQQFDAPNVMHVSEVATFDKSLVLTPQPTIMPAWTAPTTAAEALDLLYDRESEIDAIIAQAKQVGADALLIRVTDADSKAQADKVLESIVERKDRVIELLDPFRKVLYESYDYAGKRVKAGKEPLEQGIEHVKKQILAYNREQERLRQAAIQKARDEAAAEERRRQEAESQRLTLAEVTDKLEQGDVTGAQFLFDQPIQAPRQFVQPEYIPPATSKVQGQSTSSKWAVDRSTFEGDDEAIISENRLQSVMTILKAVKEDKYDMRSAARLLWWDMPACNKLASALKNAFQIPGLTAIPVDSLSVRRNK